LYLSVFPFHAKIELGTAFAVPNSQLASTSLDFSTSATKAVEGRACCGMAEAMPFPVFPSNPNSRFLGRAKYALGRNDNLDCLAAANVQLRQCLAAAAGAAAASAAVAAAVAGHDAAAEAAAGGVA